MKITEVHTCKYCKFVAIFQRRLKLHDYKMPWIKSYSHFGVEKNQGNSISFK